MLSLNGLKLCKLLPRSDLVLELTTPWTFWAGNSLLFPPLKKNTKQGNAGGASEVRRGTSSIHSIVRCPSRPVILGMKKSGVSANARRVPKNVQKTPHLLRTFCTRSAGFSALFVTLSPDNPYPRSTCTPLITGVGPKNTIKQVVLDTPTHLK